MAAQHKTKQYLLAFAKVLVLAITFGYIFYRIKNNPDIDFSAFFLTIVSKGAAVSYFLILFLVLAMLNWTFEILKWQNLVSSIDRIDFKTALKQSLASLTVSLATPNRIGEYGAKALFFEKENRKKILLLNFYSNAAQLTMTVVFGCVGLFYFLWNYEVVYSVGALLAILITILVIGVLGYYFRKRELFVQGFSIANTLRFFQKFPSFQKLKVLVFSLLRYLIFSGMFYGMLLFFGAEVPIYTAMALIFAMYLLVSIVPTIFIFDVVVRGGVAVWLFSFVGIPELAVLSTVFLMWIFNFVVPSLIGSFFLITYQPAT